MDLYLLKGIVLAAAVILIAKESNAQMDAFEELSEADAVELICKSMLSAEYDVLNVAVGADPGKLAAECGQRFFDQTLGAHLSLQAKESNNPSFGSMLVEERSKWSIVDDIGYISVSNPYPAPLLEFSAQYWEKNCSEQSPSARYADFKLNEPVPPDSTRIVRFDPSTLSGSTVPDCLIVNSTSFATWATYEELESKLFLLADAGAWEEVGTSLDQMIALKPIQTEKLVKELELKVKVMVRALPASRSVENRDGYRLLTFLNPQNSDYVTRLNRYQVASLPERTLRLKENILRNAPFTTVEYVFQELSADRTRAQRDEAWEALTGKKLELIGRVIDVKSSGLLSSARIDIEIKDGFSGSCFVKDFLNEAAIEISRGSKISCTGELFVYSLIFGELNVGVREAHFAR